MTIISDENGILNNFAKEPAMYHAQAPSTEEKRGYVGWGAIALVVVVASVLTAVFVS